MEGRKVLSIGELEKQTGTYLSKWGHHFAYCISEGVLAVLFSWSKDCTRITECMLTVHLS